MEVDDRYLKEIERYSRRFIALQTAYMQLLSEVSLVLPPDRFAHYTDRLRGIDIPARCGDNGNQGNNDFNKTT